MAVVVDRMLEAIANLFDIMPLYIQAVDMRIEPGRTVRLHNGTTTVFARPAPSPMVPPVMAVEFLVEGFGYHRFISYDIGDSFVSLNVDFPSTMPIPRGSAWLLYDEAAHDYSQSNIFNEELNQYVTICHQSKHAAAA